MFDRGTDTVAALRRVRRKKNVGISRLTNLLEAQAGLQFPGAAEEITAAVFCFDSRASIGAVTGTQRHLIRRALAQQHAHRRSHPLILYTRRRVSDLAAFQRDVYRRKVRRTLQGCLQGQQPFLAIVLAGLDAAVEAFDEFRRIALQAADAYFAEAVARPAHGDDPQVDAPDFRIDFGEGLLQVRGGVVHRQQVGKKGLLGLIPIGLPEGLPGFEFPGTCQRLATLRIERTRDLDMHAADPRACPGIDLQQQFIAALVKHDNGREVPLGSQQPGHLTLHPALESRPRRSVGDLAEFQVITQQFAHLLRRHDPGHRGGSRDGEQQGGNDKELVHEFIGCRRGKWRILALSILSMYRWRWRLANLQATANVSGHVENDHRLPIRAMAKTVKSPESLAAPFSRPNAVATTGIG
jgi:hypothetical protein